MFIVLSATIYGQDTPTKPTLEYGFSISPEVNYLMTHRSGEQSEASPGLSSSLFVHRDIGNRLAIETGLGFGIKQINHLQTGLIFGSDIDPQQGILSYSSLETNATLNEIQLPVSGVLTLAQSHFSLVFGLTGHYQWTNNAKRIIHHGSGGENTQLNSTFNPLLNFSTAIGFRYTQPISQKIGLIVEPKFTFYFREYIVPLTRLCCGGLKLGLILG